MSFPTLNSLIGPLGHTSLAQARLHMWKFTFPSNEAFLLCWKKKKNLCFPLLLEKIPKSKTDLWLFPWAHLLPSLFYFSVPSHIGFVLFQMLPYGNREFAHVVPTVYKFLHPIPLFNLLTPAQFSGLRETVLKIQSQNQMNVPFLRHLSCIYAHTSVNI